jgi:Fic family protein
MDSTDLGPSSGDVQVFAVSQGLESNFSNIEELEAEHLESSIENNSAEKKQIQTSESPNMKFEEIDATDRSLANHAVNRGEDSGMRDLELSAQMDSNETCLDNLIIRDATD